MNIFELANGIASKSRTVNYGLYPNYMLNLDLKDGTIELVNENLPFSENRYLTADINILLTDKVLVKDTVPVTKDTVEIAKKFFERYKNYIATSYRAKSEKELSKMYETLM